MYVGRQMHAHTQIQADFAVAFPSGALFLSRLSQFKKAVCGDAADPTQLGSGSTTVCAAQLLTLGKFNLIKVRQNRELHRVYLFLPMKYLTCLFLVDFYVCFFLLYMHI